MKRENLILFVLVLIVLVNPLVSSLTASIDKPRMVLYKNISEDKLEFENSVIVNNVNEYEINIKTEGDNTWKDYVEIYEPEFTLVAGESKEVFYKITLTKPGLYSGDILVSFSEEELGTSVVLAQALEVFVKNDKKSSNITGNVIGNFTTGILGILIIILVLVIKLRRTKQ